MIDQETGQIDPTRFGWDNRLTGGAPLGSHIRVPNLAGIRRGMMGQEISKTITEGLTIDATGTSAFWLGFTKGMQYNGLDRGTVDNLPGSSTPLTNCFASMYSLITSFDTFGYNLSTINSEPGSFKGFDVLVIDPTHIIADTAVNYEMCEIGGILDQVKGMAGLDYAAIGDNLTRELLVLAVEQPKYAAEVKKMADGAKCAQGVAQDYQEEDAKDKKKKDDEDEFKDWDGDEGDSNLNFAADPEESAEAAVECFALVDRFTIGDLSGQLFASFFNNELKPLI